MTTYTGNSGNNTINGSNGDDTINGLGGNDTLNGGNGNDTIDGGADNDAIDGGNGNDTLIGGSGDDSIDGGNGNDSIDGGTGNDTIEGGNGNDTIAGGDDNDSIDGGNGNDVIAGGAGNDNLLGDNGDDSFTGGGGDDVIDGGNGFDTAYYSGPVGEYSFFNSGGYLHVVHLGGAGADGHDQLKRVERLVFADRVIIIGGGNNAPVAGDDHVFINEDTGVYSSGAASVKDNDFDFDGDTLTVTSGVFVGTYGTLTLNANGTYSYALFASAQALAQGQNVTDSFNYTVSDNDGSDTGALVFHIAGVNDAPNADPDTASAGENQTILINVLANDDDIDNGAVLTVTTASAPSGQGIASVVGNQVQFNPGTDFDDLAVGQTEIVVISYSITDEHGATDSSTITVTVTGTNDAPVAVADTNSGDPVVESGVNPGNTPFPGDASAAGNVLANDTDPDSGDTKTVSAVNGVGGNVGAAVAGTYGSVTIASNGSYTYTLNNADPDTNALAQGASVNDVFSYTVQDSNGATSTTSLTITITGTNDAPVAVADTNSGDPVVESGVNPGNTPFPGDGSAAGNVLANDTDVDSGDTKAVSAVNGSALNVGTAVAGTYGSVTIASDGSYTYTLDNADPDTNALAQGESVDEVFSYSVVDANGATSTTSLTITITGTNDAPTIDAGGTVDSGAVTELPNNDANENSFTHTDSGTVAFDDVDVPDTHSASFTAQGGGYLGTFTLDPVDQPGDSVGWDFSVEDSDLDFLDEGETLTQIYTIEIEDANGAMVTQDVTITLTGAGDGPQTEWYIDNSAVGSANLGTEADPFTSIASFNAAQGMVGGPQIGHTVHLLAGTGTGIYAEADGINLLDDQILTGEATGAVRPTIVTTGGTNHGIELAQNNTVSGLDIGDTMGADISDSNGAVGNLTIFDVGTSGTGQIIDIDQGGTLNVTLNSASSLGSTGGAIDLANVGGSFTVTGATTITGVHSGGGIDITGASAMATFAGGGTVATLTTIAVNYAGNSGALAIGGGFDIVTTSGAGLNASGGGTVTVTGAGNSVTSTTGTAVTISGTDIGLAGVTFESVSANGAVNGILLSNTGTSAGIHGGLVITGDAGGANNGSGGTIQNTTGAGISLSGTRDTSLDQVNIQNGLDDGINGSNVTNFTLTNSTVTNNGNAGGEHGADFTNLLGAGTFTNTVFSNNEVSQISIANASGTASIALTGVSASSTGLAAAPNGLHGVNLITSGTASADLIVLGSAFDNLFSNSVNATNSGSGTLEVTIATTDFTNVGASAINIVQNSSGTVRFYIHDNDTFLRGTNNGTAASININQAGAVPAGAVLEGAISDNVIGNNSSSTSATTGGDGIRVFSVGAGTTTVRIDGNDIQGVGGNGINAQMSGSANAAHTMNVTMFDNFVLLTDINSFDGIRVVAGAAAGNAGILRLDMHDNIASSANTFDFTVRQRFATTVQLLNYVGGNTDLVAVQNYLDVTRNNNPTGPAADWQISTQAPGGGFVNTASVPAPTLPSPLLASAPAPAGHIVGADNILDQAGADQLVAAAIQRWADAGATADQIAAMQAVSVTVSDMAGPFVGSSGAGAIRLDSDGAGYGWFIDSTPGEDGEFEGSGTHLTADAGGAAEGRIDALTVIMHELGHQIGLGDDYHAADSDLMSGYIDPGERRLPDGVFEAETAANPAGRPELGDMTPGYPDLHPLHFDMPMV